MKIRVSSRWKRSSLVEDDLGASSRLKGADLGQEWCPKTLLNPNLQPWKACGEDGEGHHESFKS